MENSTLVGVFIFFCQASLEITRVVIVARKIAPNYKHLMAMLIEKLSSLISNMHLNDISLYIFNNSRSLTFARTDKNLREP